MPNNTRIYLTLPNSPEIQSQLLQQGVSLCLELLFKYRMLQNLSCHRIFSSTSYYWPLATTQCAFPKNASLATETGDVGMWISRSAQHTAGRLPPGAPALGPAGRAPARAGGPRGRGAAARCPTRSKRARWSPGPQVWPSGVAHGWVLQPRGNMGTCRKEPKSPRVEAGGG